MEVVEVVVCEAAGHTLLGHVPKGGRAWPQVASLHPSKARLVDRP